MKRRLLKLGLLVLAGAIVNVAVAWAIELRWPNPTSDKIPLARRHAQALWTKYLPDAPAFWYAERYCGPAKRLDIVGIGDHVLIVAVGSKGWPALALSSASKVDSAGHYTSFDEWDFVPGSLNPLPLRPIFPGFAINTIFYAVILWLLFAAPFKVRHWRRIRRGLCAACAYPVGTSETCTECGRPVRAKYVEAVA